MIKDNLHDMIESEVLKPYFQHIVECKSCQSILSMSSDIVMTHAKQIKDEKLK